MSTFDDFERSVEDSTPIELFTFTSGFNSWQITSYHKDVVFNGTLFTAEPLARSNIESYEAASDSFDASVELPATHPLVQEYANGVPQDTATCLIQRWQPSFSPTIALRVWQGNLTALSFKGRMGSFRVPSATVEALQHEVPNMLAQPLCNHTLYDSFCTVSRASFMLNGVQITAVSGDGRTITINGDVPAAIFGATPNATLIAIDWALHGYIVHQPSGNFRTIIDQPNHDTNRFTIQCEYPAGSLHVNDFVTIFAGCARTRAQCRAKFANVKNFGGHPDMPKSNAFYTKNIFSSSRSAFTTGDN